MRVELDPDRRGDEVQDVEKELLGKVAGQDEAVKKVSEAFQIFLAGLNMPNRPCGIFLLLGPTGTGKTYLVESAAEAITRSARSVLKIDCAEFQQSHEIAKLIGAPPGYIGHNTTTPVFTQDNLRNTPFILFDEIEKAHESLRQLMLGILDKGMAKLGNNELVDFSRTFIFMTSNLGARDMDSSLQKKMGFAPVSIDQEKSDKESKETVKKAGMDALAKAFSPEFINRLDHVMVFNPLKQDDLYKILDRELAKVQDRILGAPGFNQCVFVVEDEAKKFLVDVGYDPKYGARYLKRAIEKHIVFPLSSLMATRQIGLGDKLYIGRKPGQDKMSFTKETSGALILKKPMTLPCSALMKLDK